MTKQLDERTCLRHLSELNEDETCPFCVAEDIRMERQSDIDALMRARNQCQLNLKLVEIRDEGTCILALAMQMMALPASTETKQVTPDAIAYWFLHSCSGYSETGSSIVLMVLDNQKATSDPIEWFDLGWRRRTMGTAHNWIIDNWDALKSGDVVDVRVIVGEKKESAVSERKLSI